MLTNDFLNIMGNIVQNIIINTLKTSLYPALNKEFLQISKQLAVGVKKMLAMSLIQPTFGCLSIFRNTVSHLKVQSKQQSKAYSLN